MAATKKKMNTYLKFGLKMTAFAIGGGIVGFCSVYFKIGSLGSVFKTAADAVRAHLLEIQAFFLIASVLIGEPVLYQLRTMGRALADADDEEGDRLEYKMEWLGSVGTVSSIAGMVLAMVFLSTGYSMDYIESLSASEDSVLCLIFVLFILDCIYNGFWQVRYVKTLQKIYPRQNADIASMKFQEQWLENCDEAEREMIYQASYKSRLALHKLVSFLSAAAMLCHLFWNTGIMAVVMVGIIWIALTVTYCHACVKKKGSKLNT